MPETFPAAINRLGRLIEEADGTLAETVTIPSTAPYQHALGTALTPAAMAGVPVIPHGAVPISPPAAPSVGVGNPVTGPGRLTANSAYAWCLVNVTDYGETPAGPALVVSSIGAATSYRVGLPNPLEGTADAPIQRRRLYRTAAGGSAAGPFGLVATLDELAATSDVDTLADADLGPPPPTANTSGLPPVVAVAYVSGGVGALTEVVTGAPLTTGTFSCDYSLSPTGGVLSFASGDAGRVVVVTYVAASLITETLIATITSGLQQLVAALGAANGVAALNAQRQVIQDPASRGQPGGVAPLDDQQRVVGGGGAVLGGPVTVTTATTAGTATLTISSGSTSSIFVLDSYGSMTIKGNFYGLSMSMVGQATLTKAGTTFADPQPNTATALKWSGGAAGDMLLLNGSATIVVPANAANGVHVVGGSGSAAQPELSLDDGTIQKGSLSLAFASGAFSALANAGDAILRALNSAGNLIISNQNDGKVIIFGIGPDSAHDVEVMRLTTAGIVGGGGASNGVAALNAQRQVIQPPAAGVRQTVPLVNTADVWLDSGHQNSREPGTPSDYILLFTIPIVTTGGNIEVRCSGFPFNILGNGNWLALGVSLDAGTVTERDYAISSSPQPAGGGAYPFDRAVHAEHLWLSVPAGAHTVHIMGQSGGAGPVPQASGFLSSSHPHTSPFHAIVSEIA